MIGYKEQGETDGLRTKLPTEGAREEISYRGVLHLCDSCHIQGCVRAIVLLGGSILLEHIRASAEG